MVHPALQRRCIMLSTQHIFISGADRGLGFGMTEQLLSQGHIVYAGQYMPEWTQLKDLKARYPDSLFLVPLDVGSDESVKAAAKTVANLTSCLDVLISNAGINGHNDKDKGLHIETDTALLVYNVNALGSARLVEHLFPLLEAGSEKKLCFISSEAGSITQCWRSEMFGYCMSKAALNMYVRILFNQLRPKGYRFRLYHPGWIRSYMSGSLNPDAKLDIADAARLAISYFFSQTINEDELVLYGYDGERFSY